MNDRIGDSRKPRRVWLRWLGVPVAVASVALLAACSSSSSSNNPSTNATSSASGRYAQALAFSQCMRSNGVPNFPDPNSQGTWTGVAPGSDPTNPNTVAKGTALNKCRHLLPGGGTTSPSQAQANYSQALKYSQCMRAHGLRDFPDPTNNSAGTRMTLPSDITPQSPRFQAAQRACQSLMPAIGSQAP